MKRKRTCTSEGEKVESHSGNVVVSLLDEILVSIVNAQIDSAERVLEDNHDPEHKHRELVLRLRGGGIDSDQDESEGDEPSNTDGKESSSIVKNGKEAAMKMAKREIDSNDDEDIWSLSSPPPSAS